METNEIIKRINIVKSNYRLSEAKLAEITDTKATTVNGYMLRKDGDSKKVPVSFIYKILNAFPDVSAEWLLRGEGNMLKSMDNKSGASNVIVGNVGGNATQSVGIGTPDSKNLKTRLALMVKGCVSKEDFEFVLNDIIDNL